MGVDKRGEILQIEFWLVNSFHKGGSLFDFLKSNILTWDDLMKISLTMATGLALLHGVVPSDIKFKYVLIRSDLTACIGDFDLALQFRPNEGTSNLSNIQPSTAEQVLIPIVARLRESCNPIFGDCNPILL